ncbi:hypothetical protein VTN77DRAFT_5305 [Rasamsonia byssochlamydoides]|uniref:uncharacterized protein n=1 Tax=Rasamsonia byssochlamydoides TaxID=89139 RepID=UPI0037430852
MKLAAISLAFTALVAGTAAQSLSDLPQCAQNCATNAIPAQCGLDVKCICSTQSFIASITCCVAKACDQADQEATIKFADSLCSTAGVTNLPQSAVCTTAASATGSQTSTASESTASSETSSSSATAASTTASTTASSTASSSGSSTSSTATSKTSSVSASAVSPSGTSAAAPIAQTQNGGVIAGAGAAAVLVAMLLA